MKLAKHRFEEEPYIKPIKSGTTIDHIPAGVALKVLKVLKLSEHPTTVAMRVPSKKMGTKDLIFIENKYLTKDEINKVALLARNATVNIVKDWRVVEKKKLTLPSEAIDLIKCINPNCISNIENIATRFFIMKNPERAKCYYCETIMGKKEIEDRIKY
jgi:aspartate carbamoyltransferase regulatory subunit